MNFLSDNQKKKKNKIKNITKIIKVEIPSCGAAITPPLGPVLGQYGMNTMEFCKEFNEESKIFEKDTIIPTVIYLALDKSFYFELKTPGVAYFIKKYLESNEFSRKKDLLNNINKKKDNELGYYFVNKNHFLRFLYDVALLKLTYIKSNENNTNLNINIDSSFSSLSLENITQLKLSNTFLKNYIRSMLGTARSFGIKFL